MTDWRKISGMIFVVGLILAIVNGRYFLPILFFALAASSIARLVEKRDTGAIYGAIWMTTLGLCFLTGQWSLIVGGVIASAVVSMMGNPGHKQRMQQPPTAYYQPPATYTPPPQQQVYKPDENYQQYQEGYTPQAPVYTPSPEHKYGEQTANASNAYEQPQAQYPEQRQPQ